MLGILKKEVKTYFTTMIGYAFVAFLLLIVGFVFYYINIKSGSPFIGTTLAYTYVSVVMMVLVPVMTMKIFADERHSRTDQMIFTAPVTVGQIVMGKFLAVATVFTIPVLVICCYPLVIADFGTTPVLANFVSILGFWLMGLTLFSIGLFISSLTENQIISAVVTFAVLLFIYILQFITGIFSNAEGFSAGAIIVLVVLFAAIYYMVARKTVEKALIYAIAVAVVGAVIVIVLFFVNSSMFAGLFPNFMLHCSIYYMYSYYFSAEILDLESLVYFISLIALFLFLTTQAVEKRRFN